MNCPRCGTGNAIYRDDDGDLACIVCGHRMYATPPLPLLQNAPRMSGPGRNGAKGG